MYFPPQFFRFVYLSREILASNAGTHLQSQHLELTKNCCKSEGSLGYIVQTSLVWRVSNGTRGYSKNLVFFILLRRRPNQCYPGSTEEKNK